MMQMDFWTRYSCFSDAWRHGSLTYTCAATGTTVFLVAAKQLLSVLPVMVPCFILFWVALELTLWGLWSLRPEMGRGNTTGTSRDDRGHTHGHAHPAADDGSDAPREALRPLEYTLVVAMVFVSLVPFNKILSDETGLVGMSIMIFLGLFFAFVNTVSLLRETKHLVAAGNISSMRSNCMRSTEDEFLLTQQGHKTVVLKLARTVVSFHNVGLLHRTIAKHVDKDADVVILDLSLVQRYSFDAGQWLLDTLTLTASAEALVLVCGITPPMLHRLRTFGAPLTEVGLYVVGARVRGQHVLKHFARLHGLVCTWAALESGISRDSYSVFLSCLE
eukprot:m.1124026 g.1124026  ORF g.1124026 m.1124026 type:complete len:332 (+) comp24407_c1_seq7:199-1194(+)